MATQPSASASRGSGFRYLLDFEKPIIQMEEEIQRLEAGQLDSGRDYSDEIATIRKQLDKAMRKAYANLTPWETVLVARHPRRPLFQDYVRLICKDFCELHGDRLFADDRAIITGFARIAGHKVMLVGQNKGRDTREKIEANFGCAHPDGYRKALRKMQLAAKFHVPVVCLIDTPGAYPGIGAEERGIAAAIAENLMHLSRLPTPVIACVIGEGGSGGALGIAVADEVAVMEHAYYSVISPEGCAAILWKSGEHAARAANALQLTADNLKKLDLIDTIIEEPLGGAHRHPEETAKRLESWIDRSLTALGRLKTDTILKRRYQRLRNLGSFFVDTGAKATKAKRAGSRKPRTSARQAAAAART
ncbi:MAG: acetyl-CoA carboxylase carboxyltransferase subunit alpha [Planctomycetota bacterium]|nr:MAG: acetyl-CoA carboxylase carboxyltransferase subunit alpha [Planctomycetota bacterium]